MSRAGRKSLGIIGPLALALAVASAPPVAASTACGRSLSAPAAAIREPLPPEDGGPPRVPERVYTVNDGLTCANGQWMKGGRKATRAEIKAHQKRLMMNRLQ